MKVPSSHLSYCIINKNWTFNSYIMDKQNAGLCSCGVGSCRMALLVTGQETQERKIQKKKKAQISIKFTYRWRCANFHTCNVWIWFFCKGRTFSEIPKLFVDSHYVSVFPGNGTLPACYVALRYLVDSFSCSVLILVWREDMVVVQVATTLTTPGKQQKWVKTKV